MGCGSWTRDSYISYSTTKGMSVSTDGMIIGSYSNQDMFKAVTLDHTYHLRSRLHIRKA